MELTNLEGLARCLAHSRADNASTNDFTWKKIERLIRLCPNCLFKSVNRVPAIRQLRGVLERQRDRKPQFDRLYPAQDQLLDIKPETIYHFDELEQQAVLSLCKYLCISHGQYLHKILPLLLRYLATLHLAKWPPHYFKNLFLMKFQHQENALNTNDNKTINNNNNIIEEENDENKTNNNENDNNNNNNNNSNALNAIEEEPIPIDGPTVLNQSRQSMLVSDDDDDDNTISKTSKTQKDISKIKPGVITPGTSMISEKSDALNSEKIDKIRHSDDENKIDEHEETVNSTEIEIKYDEDIPDNTDDIKKPQDSKPKTTTNPSTTTTMGDDMMKYMDNPLRSPICQFVMEFIYNIGDISHAVEESANIIRQGIIIILKEYIKILKEDNDDINDNIGITHVSDIHDIDDTSHHKSNTNKNNHHSFYIILPIIWGILNAIKEDAYVSINIDRKSALSISKCVDTLSKYNNNNKFSTLWKSEWDILSTGVRASLLAYFLPPQGPIEKPPKKFFETNKIKDYFKLSMDIIGVKKSICIIEVREQHMRLATICAIYERSLRQKLEKTIKEILNFHISKYIKSSFNVYKISPSKQNNKLVAKQNKSKHHSSGLKYRMRDQTILINACCLVLEQLAERAPRQLQEISYYFQRLLIDRNAIYLQDEEINERLMDALARVCQCELKYMEETYKNNQLNKKNIKNVIDEFEDEIDEEKQLLFDDMKEEEKEVKLDEVDRDRIRKHHKKQSSGLFFSDQHNKHWYDDSSTRTVFNELENNFNDSVNEDSKLINRALRIYGAMMVKVNHKLITQQFLTSSLKGRLTQKLTVILPYLIDTAINQQATEILFVKEIVQLLVQSYLTKSSYQLDTKRKIAEAFTELSSNLNQYNLRQFVLCELLKMFTTLSKTILGNHIKKEQPLVLASNELGLILPAIAVLCTPLYIEDIVPEEDIEQDEQEVIVDDNGDKKSKKKNIFGKKRRKRHKESDVDVYEVKKNEIQDIINEKDDEDKNPSYFGTNEYIAEEYGVTLMDNHVKTVLMFREFWNQIIFFDFVSSTSNEYKIYLQTIANVTPVLVTGSSTLFGGGLIHEVLKNKTNSMHINKQISSMRSKLQSVLVKIDVNHLEPDALLFLNVVYHVESFRVYSGNAYSLGHYLNDTGVLRMDLTNCVETVVDYVFDRYLDNIYQSKASSEKLRSLESHCEYLLAMCCSRSSRIRSKCYNWLQHKLIANYSYLQWRPKCLQNVLDIVSKLETLIDDVSTELYSINDSHSVITFNHKFSLDLPEDRKSRAEIRTIILEIAGSWLHSAWNLAPSEMISVVAHKLSLYKSPLLSSLMYTQCKFTNYRVWDNDINNNKPNMGLMYVVSKCERYLGVMEGLYRTHLLHHIQKSFGHSKAQLFIQTFKKYIAMHASKKDKNSKQYFEQLEQGMIEEMYQVGALIVWTYNKQTETLQNNNNNCVTNNNNNNNNSKAHHFKLPLEELLNLLCMVPAIVFTNNLVLCGTFVWRWIMTTSPELQEALIRQMRPAWTFVIEQRKGIFANKHVNHKEIDAHNIWISWLLNSIENIIESSPESVENISVIMIDGLAAIPHYTDDGNNTTNTNNNSKKKANKPVKTSKTRPKAPNQKAPTAKQIRFSKQRDRKGSKRMLPNASKLVNRNNSKKEEKVNVEKHEHEQEQGSEDIKHSFDTYIATFGSTLRFYTAVARILSALRMAAVPLLSKTIATMLRSRLYQGILKLFECKIVWRYPSSWKDVSSNAKAIVELFQFFMTEHRHVIKRYKNTSDTNIGGTDNKNIPSVPNINIENHRSKSKLQLQKNNKSYNTLTLQNTSMDSINNGGGMRNSGKLTTTMPYLNTTITPSDGLMTSSLTPTIAPLRGPRHSPVQMRYRHKKTQSFHYNSHRTLSNRRTQRTFTKSKTNQAPSIRRNSFGHSKNTSFDLDTLHNHNHNHNHGTDTLHEMLQHRSPMHSSIRSLHQTRNSGIFTMDTLLLQTEHDTISDAMQLNDLKIVESKHHTINYNLSMYKLDFDDVYYWEGNNAFIQDPITNWLDINSGWCQMICCVLLSDELERLCAWYNTRDADNIHMNGHGNDDFNHKTGHGNDDINKINRVDSGGGHGGGSNNGRKTRPQIDDRISKFLYQEELIEYINKIRDCDWSKLLNVTWTFSSLLSFRFYERFKYKDYKIEKLNSLNNLGLKTIKTTLAEHIHLSPKSICNIAEAVHLLITDTTVKKDGIELENLCSFSVCPLYKCLGLLKEKNLTHSIVNQYLFRSLRYESQINMEGVIFLIPQLLQALRFDPSGILRQFLISCAMNDLTMAHQLIWLCDCESYEGEDMYESKQSENNDFCREMMKLSLDIQNEALSKSQQFYASEFEFFDLINSASVDIDANKYDKKDKKRLIRAALIEIRDSINKYKLNENKLYMPTNPTWEIIDILPDTVIALQSAAKVPFLVDFQVRKYNDDIAHILFSNSNSNSNSNKPLKLPKIEIQKCIFKTHDDCGQDALALQIIEYFSTIFKKSGLPLLLFPYRVIATRSGRDKVVGGMIECVKNARSRADLGAENNYRLRRYFIETYGNIESKSFRKAQRNFILSLAGYAVVCYLLQIKDRHNANIMINNDGHLIHIDFGFLFDISPGKNIGFETAGFKINDEMVELIGDDGSHTTPLFLWFVELCIRGYLVCRQHMDEITSIIQLSSNSNLPCFLPQTMQNLNNRFVPHLSNTQAAQHMKERVIHACSTWTTNAYDKFQEYTQNIWKAPARDED